MEISTSFSKKINLQAYGGTPYESEDVFVSLKNTIDIPDSASLDEATKLIEAETKILHSMCVGMTESFLKERINQLKR